MELRIESLAAGGAGVGRLEGGAVFVAGAAPGDLVEIELDRGARPARGALLRVLQPGPARVEPPCPHAAACGGCDWMHVAPEAQEQAHAGIVREAIARATPRRDLPLDARGPSAPIPAIRVHPAPAQLGYRTRARLFARAERGLIRVGYRAAGTHALVEIERCLVLCDALAPLLGELPEVLRGARGEGDLLVARGAGERPVVELAWRGDLPPGTFRLVDERVAAGAWAGARVALEGASRPATFGDPSPVVRGADELPLVLASGGFGQPSEEGASVLARRVAELARIDPSAEAGDEARRDARPAWRRPPHVLELFAGSGTLSVLLARGAPGEPPASFVAVERSAEAITCLRRNLAARGLQGKAVVADADAQPIPARTDLVVLDPPRGGAAAAARAIAASSARAVVYVSCDPATLARDLALLLGGGRLEITDVEIVELFPQTSHVETIVRLARPRRARR
ncbi:MAG: class I SAM-dependent RNA methyltransferase [Polyangiaceae bacterium]|nr:class I SAM-dependent RNA methyltransferase [Polyangiaceae bacterium]